MQNLDRIKRTLHVREGEATEDRMFSLETVNCLGTCAMAPVIQIDGDYHDAVIPGKIDKILAAYSAGHERQEVAAD